MNQLQLFAERDVVDVLVVDGDRRVADLIRRRLKRAGSSDFVVAWRRTAAEALASIQAHAPDVIVVGVSVGDPTSLGWVGRLRSVASEVPVVVLHHTDAGPVRAARDAAVDASLEAVVTGAQDVLSLDEANGSRLERVLRHAIARSRTERAALATASADTVTGLGSRWWIEERLERAVAHAGDAGPGWQIAVLFIDLDRFKLVNDTLGHAAGDQLLRMVADRLRAAVRSDDPIARFGGDEFVIVLEGHRVDGLAQRIAMRTLSAFTEPFRIDGHQFSVFTSIGLAVHERHESAATLLEHADAACYRAKRRGRNRVVVYDDAMREWADHRLGVTRAFTEALESAALDLDVRTLVDLRARRRVGYVVAPTWSDLPSGESVVGIAARAGLGPTLGRWLIETTIEQVAAAPDERIEIELPDGLIAQPSFAGWLSGLLVDASLDASQLVLLVDEGEFDEPELIGPSLSSLADRGVGVALNRFGEGVSSLTLFSSAQVDEVRLSARLTRNVARDPAVRSTLAGLVQLADSVGQVLTAARVADVETATTLASLGLHAADGDGDVFSDLIGRESTASRSDSGEPTAASDAAEQAEDATVISLVGLHHPAVSGPWLSALR